LGSFRESILRDLLHKYTPYGTPIKSGFVCSSSKPSESVYEKQSKQIDCLVYDKVNFMPLIETSDMAAVVPNSLYAAIEVKSSLTISKEKPKNTESVSREDYPFGAESNLYRYSGTLVNAFQNIHSISFVSQSGISTPAFRAIFAYEMTTSIENVIDIFNSNELFKQLNVNSLSQLPFCICVPGSFIVIFSKNGLIKPSSQSNPKTAKYDFIYSDDSESTLPLQIFLKAYHESMVAYINHKKPNQDELFSLNMKDGKYYKSSGEINFG
jgi:hypothetical protein